MARDPAREPADQFPDPSTQAPEDTELVDLVEDAHARFKRRRLGFERDWFRSILFLLGIQWIKWDEHTRQFRKRRLLDWVPTPVTNRFASTGERLVAVLSRVEPNWIFVPATDNEQDIAAADVATKLEKVLAEENQIDDVRQKVARWLVYTGNAFLLSWVEQRTQPLDVEALAPKLAQMGITPEQITPETMATLLPPPEYRLYTDVYSPFQVYANMSVESLDEQERVLIIERRDVNWVNQTYGVQLDEEAADYQADAEDLSLQYLESIGYSSSEAGFVDHAFGRDQAVPRVTVKRLFLRPTEKFPKGLYVVVAKGIVLEKVDLPTTKEGKPYIPLVQFKFDAVPGAFFGRTPMFDLVPKQVQRNKLESLIELITMRMASPIWVVPEGTVVKGWNVGEPGSILRYQIVGDKGQKPDRLEGSQIPNSIVVWLNKIDADFEELAATAEVLKGEVPYSGAPGVVVQQLIEQGLSRFGPAFRGMADSYRKLMKIWIELFRVYGQEPRLLRVMGDNAKWKVEKFTAADIEGAVDVRIESETTVPRSEMVEAAKILEAVNLGLIDISDPDIHRMVLKKLQLHDMHKMVDAQVLDAVKENERMAAGEQVPVKPFLDDHVIHIAKHKAFALSEEAQQVVQVPGPAPIDERGQPLVDPMTGLPVPPPMIDMKIQDIVLRHLAEHNMIMDAEMVGKPAPGGGPAGPDGKPADKGESALAPNPQPTGSGGPSAVPV